jgi:hypothetical protein
MVAPPESSSAGRLDPSMGHNPTQRVVADSLVAGPRLYCIPMGARRALRWGELALCAAVAGVMCPGPSWAADDGNEIDVTFDASRVLVWAADDGYSTWNIYTGDLQVLRDTGVYTQPEGSSVLVDRLCNEHQASFHYFDVPAPGQCAFFLVSGNRGATEGGLGTDSVGVARANTRACDIDVTPPDPPGTPTVAAGHCRGLWVSWPPSPSGDVASYHVRLGTAPNAPFMTRGASTTSLFVDRLDDGVTYYVSVDARDTAGNFSPRTAEVVARTVNATTPRAPEGLAIDSEVGRSRLTWSSVASNEEQVPGDPASPVIRDLAGYRVYRSTSTTIPTDAAHRIADTTSNPGGTEVYNDLTLIACRHYTYVVTAVDTCGIESAPSTKADTTAPMSAPPRPPTFLQAFRVPGGSSVSWNRTVSDVDDHAIAIDAYRIERSDPSAAGTPPERLEFAPIQDVTGGATSWTDVDLPPLHPDETLLYRVAAFDDCPTFSEPSDPVPTLCLFSGETQIQSPSDGALVAGVVPTTVLVTGGSDTYAGVTIRYTHETAGLTRTFTSSTQSTSWTDTGWLATPPGNFTIEATVTNAAGCSKTRVTHVTAGDTVPCCVSKFPTNNTLLACAGGSAKCKQVSFRIGNDRCRTSVALSSMSIAWTDFSGNKPRWQTANFNGSAIAAAGSWTTTYDGTTNELGTASRSSFGPPAPTVSYATPMTTANTTSVTYVFDKATDSGIGASRKVDIFGSNSYTFTLLDSAGNPTTVHTTCEFGVLTVN